MEKLIINGIEYERIQHETKPSRKGTSRMLALASMMAMMGGAGMMDYGSSSYSRGLPSNIDIVKEFELIQQKKSNLSKWERDQVVHIFNQNFKPCNNIQNT